MRLLSGIDEMAQLSSSDGLLQKREDPASHGITHPIKPSTEWVEDRRISGTAAFQPSVCVLGEGNLSSKFRT